MKMGRRRAQLLLFLLSSVITCEASLAALPRELSPAKNFQNAGTLGEVIAASGGIGGSGKPVGTEHAPVDGKDGMPHEGPFVETTAERTRKKTQGTGFEGNMEAENPVLKPAYKGLSDSGLPQSNDAVMDDRVRSSPVEGTRGVEGGISEKSKDGIPTDKKPDPPKDARPLPHSEVEKINDADGSESLAAVDEDSKKVLAVCLIIGCASNTDSDTGSYRPSRKTS